MSSVMIPLYSLDFSKSVSARQKLETQVTENKIVKEVTYKCIFC